MGTTIKYGSIELRNVYTKTFHEEPVYDPSKTDIWYWKYRVAVSTVVASFPSSGFGGVQHLGVLDFGDSLTSAARQIAEIREKLLTNRLTFIMSVDGIVILLAYPPPTGGGSPNAATVDANNGPAPISCDITQFSKDTFRIEWEIEVCRACRAPTGGQGGPGRLVLGNRWSCGDEIDQHGKVSRRWEGTLRVAYAASPVQIVHALRSLALPPLVDGFRRKQMRFLGSANGLELNYSIDDEQIVGQMPPAPATFMRGTHTESVAYSGHMATGEVSAYFEGLPGTSKSELIEFAAQLANQKLGITVKSKSLVQSISIVDYFGPDTNAIEYRMRVLHCANDEVNGRTIGAARLKNIGKPVVFNKEGYVNISEMAGTALAYSMFCYLQSPCTPDHTLNVPGLFFGGPDNNDTGSKNRSAKDRPDTDRGTPKAEYREIKEGESLNGNTANLEHTKEHKENPWTHVEMDTDTEVHHGRIALPVAQAPTTSSDTTDSIVIVTLHSSVHTRTVRISAERLGKWPTLPDSKNFVLGGVKYNVLKTKIIAKDQRRSVDGKNYLYTIRAEYTYAANRAPTKAKPIVIGKPPLERGKKMETKIPVDGAQGWYGN